MKAEIGEFLSYIGTERGFSVKTQAAYSYDLTKFSEFTDKELGEGWTPENIDQYTIKAYLQYLADKGNLAVSRGRKLAVLKSFFKYLLSKGKIKSNPSEPIKMPKIKQKEPHFLSEQEYKRLLRTVPKNATKYFKQRDVAIITVMLGMGLRLSEVVGLNVGDVNFENGTIKVTRKGNQERILPANDEVMINLSRYLKTRENVTTQEPLFLSKQKKRIDNTSVWHLVKKYFRQAQLEGSPHTLRHTFATILLKQGENILTIKELLSHRNIRTTERYLHINSEDLKTAVSKIDLGVR